MGADSIYRDRLKNNYRAVERAGEVVPLDRIDAEERIGGAYRYRLGPLLLIRMEEMLGADIVRAALASYIVSPPDESVDYAAFRRRLRAAGASHASLARFETTCLVSRPWEGCLSALK